MGFSWRLKRKLSEKGVIFNTTLDLVDKGSYGSLSTNKGERKMKRVFNLTRADLDWSILIYQMRRLLRNILIGGYGKLIKDRFIQLLYQSNLVVFRDGDSEKILKARYSTSDMTDEEREIYFATGEWNPKFETSNI
jgi:hypothetical protein